MTLEVAGFWSVGRRADPLHVDVRYQGDGRFDDPQRTIPVLFGAPLLRTCLLEFILPRAPALGTSTLLDRIPEPTNDDEAVDADRDRRIARAPRCVPPVLYERIAVRVSAKPPLSLLDLRDLTGRDALAETEHVAVELEVLGFVQLDRGALLAPNRSLTQAVSGAVVHGLLFADADGLYAESRHENDVVVVFGTRPFASRLSIVELHMTTPFTLEIRELADTLHMIP